MENFTPTDAIALQGNRGYNDGMWGGEWFWIIIILFFAWGGNGFGRNNGFETDIDTRFLERDIFNTNQNVSNTACQTQRDVLENRYTTQLGFANAQAQNQACCCETQKEILQNRYDNALQTQTLSAQIAQCCCNLRAEGLANTQKVIDLIQQDKIDQLRDQVYTTNQALNNANLANTVINAVRPTPVPAYLSCSPYFAYNMGYGCNNGCGCGNATII